MPTVSAPDLLSLRAKNHRTSFYLSVLKPATLWQATIDDVGILKGATSINFDGGAGTAFGQIVDPQELWVGTSLGSDDIGRLRIKSVSSVDAGLTGNIIVAANALEFADGQFLTFKHNYPLKPRYSLISGPPSTAIFTKDTTITYTNQNDPPGPVVIAGENIAGFIDPVLAYLEVESQLPNSYVMDPGATLVTYSADTFPTTGVTVNINAGTGVGWIRFTVPGIYWTHWAVVDSNGNSQKSYRWVYVHSDDPTDEHYPIIDFTVNSLSQDWNRGGWECGIKLGESVSIDDIPDKTAVILWQVATYNDVVKNITFLPNESNTVLSGYLRKEKVEQDIQSGVGLIDFQIVTLDEILRNHYNFSISLAARETPAFWYEYASFLTCPQAAFHMWKWHSTLFEVADVFLGDNVDGRAYAEMEDGNLYSMVDDLTRGKGIRAHVVCDKGNRVHLTYDIQLLTDAERALLDVVQSIEKADRSDTITILREPFNRTAFVKTSGFTFDGTFAVSGCPDPPCPNVVALCASAPGIMPADEGANIVDFDRQVFRDQDHCNQIAGRLFAQINNKYPEVRIDFHGNYHGVLDAAYPEFWTIDLATTDTPRELFWTDQKLICRQVNSRIDVEAGTITSSVTFEPEMPGFDGVAGYCLDTVPDHGGETPVIVNPDDPEIITGSSVYVLEGTSWSLKTAEQTDDLILDPFWQTKQASTDPADAIVIRCGSGYIKRSLDGGNTWSDVTPGTDPPNTEVDAPAPTAVDLDYVMISGKLTDEFVIAANWQNAGGLWRTWLLKTDDDFATFSWAYVGAEDCTSPEGNCTGVTLNNVIINNQQTQVTFDSGVSIVVWSQTSGGNILTFVTSIEIVLGVAVPTDTVTIRSAAIADYFTASIAKIEAEKAVIIYSSASDNFAARVRTVEYSGGNIVLGGATDVFSTYEKTITSGSGSVNLGFGICCPTSGSLLVFRAGEVLDGSCTNWDNVGVYYVCATVSGTTITFTNTLCGLDTVRDWQLIDTLPNASGIQFKAIVRQSTLFTVGWMSPTVQIVKLVSGTFTDCSNITFGTIVDGSATLNTISASFDIEMINDETTLTNVACLTTSGLDGSFNEIVNITKVTFALNVINMGSPQLLIANRSPLIQAYITPLTDSRFVIDLALINQGINSCFGAVLMGYDGANFFVERLCDHQTAGTAFGVSRYSDTQYVKAHRNGYCLISTTDFMGGCAKPYAGKTVGMTLDAIGLFIYLTFWDEEQERIFLLKYDYATLNWQGGYYLDGFGVVTETDLNNQTYIAWPYTSPDDWERIYVAGRLPYPEFTTTLGHVVTTGDTGTTWDLVEDTWGAGWGSALFEKAGILFAIRSTASDAKLYKDSADLNLVLKTTLTFPNGVNLHAMKVDSSNRVVVGGDGGNAIMVLRVLSPYDASKIGNITYDHGTATGIKALEVLE